jgi:phospholipase/lecithinase/hemolysin
MRRHIISWTILTFLVGVTLGFIVGKAEAQQNTYSDQYGRTLGYGSTVGNQTTYSDQYGRTLGYGYQVGNQTTYVDQYGRTLGYESQIGTNPYPQSNPYGPNAMPAPFTGR